MRADATALDVAQFMRERFGDDIRPGLLEVRGGNGRRGGEAMVRAEIDGC